MSLPIAQDAAGGGGKRKAARQSSGREQKEKEKARKEPVRVVHFSDPILVFATPEEFKGRVQELTGISSTVADALLGPAGMPAGGDVARESAPAGAHREEEQQQQEEDGYLAAWESLFGDGLWPQDPV